LTNAATASSTFGATGNLTLTLASKAVLNNAGTLTAYAGTFRGTGSTANFNNTGTFNINAPGNTVSFIGNPNTDFIALQNSGTIHVQAGTLSLAVAITSTFSGNFS